MANQVVVLPRVRLAFPDLYVARAGKQGGPKFGANGIFAKDSEAMKRAEAAFLRAAQEEFGANWQNFLGAMESSKKCLRVGDKNLNAQTGEIRQGFAGMMYISAKNKNKPVVIADRYFQGEPVHIAEDGSAWVKGKLVAAGDLGFEVKKPYGGCIVNMKIEIGAMKAKGEIAANVFARLQAIQFVDDGEAFGAGPATADGFEDQGGDEGEGAPSTDGAGSLFG